MDLDGATETEDSLIYSNVKLDGIPEKVFGKAMCSKLVLANNSLDTFPSDLEKVPGLIELSIINNNIDDISEGFRHLHNLKKLNLCNNKIEFVPESVKNMKRLYSLSFSRNNISGMSPGISELQNLRFLYLDNNSIKRVPKAIKGLSSILILDLRNNPLEVEDDSTGYGVKSLSNVFGEALILKDGDMHPNRHVDLLKSSGRKRLLDMLKAIIIGAVMVLLYWYIPMLTGHPNGHN